MEGLSKKKGKNLTDNSVEIALGRGLGGRWRKV